MSLQHFDVVVVGGGPSGATAAHDLAAAGRNVLLLDKGGRIKPCGGAIPPKCVEEFDIPPELIVARIGAARMVSPKGVAVDMPIDGGYVGMVDREHFDEALRARAATAGATRVTGSFTVYAPGPEGLALVTYQPKGGGEPVTVSAGVLIGADGANSAVAAAAVPKAGRARFVFAYHEIVRAPEGAAAAAADYAAARCDVYYQGTVSPDFYGWIFPHGDTASVGVGSANKGFALREATQRLRAAGGLGDVETIRREGAPIPMKPAKRWDNGRDTVLAGDAAGVVAPASGEGIYYAMLGGRLAAQAADGFLTSRNPATLKTARRSFMKAHGRVFFVLGMLQHFWYRSDARRERFVAICRDPDVQHLTWQAYMHKKLVRAKPAAHLRIFMKDMAHLFGFVPAR